MVQPANDVDASRMSIIWFIVLMIKMIVLESDVEASMNEDDDEDHC